MDFRLCKFDSTLKWLEFFLDFMCKQKTFRAFSIDLSNSFISLVDLEIMFKYINIADANNIKKLSLNLSNTDSEKSNSANLEKFLISEFSKLSHLTSIQINLKNSKSWLIHTL